MKSDHLLTDVDDTWSKLAKEAENSGGKVVTCTCNGNADCQRRGVQAGHPAGLAEAARETRAADADCGEQELAGLEAGPQVKI